MADSVNRQVLLKSRPEGAPSLDNFELTQAPLPEPGEGEVLMRILYLSLDPYMRGRMSALQSYATPAALGRPMVGGTVGEIVKSRHPKYSVGAPRRCVRSRSPAQSAARSCRRLPNSRRRGPRVSASRPDHR